MRDLYLFLSLIAALALCGYVFFLSFKQTKERDIRTTARSVTEAEHFIHKRENEKKAEKIEKEKEKAFKKMSAEDREAEKKAEGF
jgi:hypothetical protein